jgi:hypothetical protein
MTTIRTEPEAVSAALRHRCRKCRSRLTEPTDNQHHAFCTRFCHTSYYRARCYVCEEPMRRKTEQQKFPAAHVTCRNEYRQFPRVYDYLETPKTPDPTGRVGTPLESADFTGSKTPFAADRPPFKCLRLWGWVRLQGDDDDWELFNAEGKRVAAVRQDGEQYWVARPRAIPEPPLESPHDKQYRRIPAGGAR